MFLLHMTQLCILLADAFKSAIYNCQCATCRCDMPYNSAEATANQWLLEGEAAVAEGVRW